MAGSLAGIVYSACTRRTESRVIRVSAHPHFSMSSLYLAKELGYFAEQGMSIEIENIPSAIRTIPPAAGGKLDVVFSSSNTSLVNAIAKGARLRIVAGREITAPDCSDNCVLFGRQEVFPNGLDDVRLLRGKRVAADMSTSNGNFGVDTILASAGMTVEDLGILRMRKSELVVSLLSKTIDAIFISDFGLRFVDMKDQIVKGIRLADILPNYQYSFIIFGARLLDGDPDTGIRFLSAYLRGVREYRKGKTPAFLVELARSNGMDPVVARKKCRNGSVADGRIDLPSLDRFVQWAVAKKLCPIPIRAKQLVDTRFLDGLALNNNSDASTDHKIEPGGKLQEIYGR